VYGSNRGHDSIVHYHRDAVTGRLTLAGHTPSGGGQPRHFALSPGGDWLIAAHEASDNLTVFSVDAANGHLEATPHSAAVPMPVCVLFDA
jgi:6-phosphogluconolactonase